MAVSIKKFRLFRHRTSRRNTLSNQRKLVENQTVLPLPFSIENKKGKTMDLATATKYTDYLIRGI